MNPLQSTRIDSGDHYILSLTATASFYAASASHPSNAIHIIDKATLAITATLPGHSGGTTSLRTAATHPPLLVSAGRDATVKAWDNRTPEAALQMQISGTQRALLSCDVSPDGLTVAAGSELKADDALILYWDPRNPVAPLHTHPSTHSDDITALHFHNNNSLLSASTDGLICISDPNEQDEDEAVLHVANWGCSIAQAGWSPSGVWAASDMETFSTWSLDLDPTSALDIHAPVHTPQHTWVPDYLVTCHSTDTALNVFVGSNEGDVGLLTNPRFADPTSPWSLDALWVGGHIGVVRALLWDQQNNILLTGGEDAKLNAWFLPPFSTDTRRDAMFDGPRKRGLHSSSPGAKRARRA